MIKVKRKYFLFDYMGALPQKPLIIYKNA